MYEQNGGRLSREGEFGRDPLVTWSDLNESKTALFSLNAPPPKVTFFEVVHSNNRLLLESIQLFFNITMPLCEHLIKHY